MDGSAIYYVICVIYIAAMAGHPLSFVGQLKVGVVGALVTCGAAPIPGGFVSCNTIAASGLHPVKMPASLRPGGVGVHDHAGGGRAVDERQGAEPDGRGAGDRLVYGPLPDMHQRIRR